MPIDRQLSTGVAAFGIDVAAAQPLGNVMAVLCIDCMSVVAVAAQRIPQYETDDIERSHIASFPRLLADRGKGDECEVLPHQVRRPCPGLYEYGEMSSTVDRHGYIVGHSPTSVMTACLFINLG
jgi:hypothetical protein